MRHAPDWLQSLATHGILGTIVAPLSTGSTASLHTPRGPYKGGRVMGATPQYAIIDPETGKIDRRIFMDQAIYDEEMVKIFGRTWLMIGHESLVPMVNDV